MPTGPMKRAGATGSIAGRRAWTQNPGGTRLTASTGGMPQTGSTDVTRPDRTAACTSRTGSTRPTGRGPTGRGPTGEGVEPGGISGAAGRHGRLGADGAHDPEVIQVPRRIRGPVARGVPADRTPAEDEEHFIPPAPPPLPKLDPMAKGAWVALFGGPGYLMVATAAGWSVSGLAAFCAVAAFVAGFAILVLRMHDPGPGGPDDGDDGAVV